MTYERTFVDVDDRVAEIITRPQEQRAHRYRYHHTGEVWALSRGREWYTRHALAYADRELDGEVLRRHIPVEQTTLADYTTDDGDEYEMTSRVVGETAGGAV